MSYDPQEVEARLRERWAESGRYEADPDGRDPDAATFLEDEFDAAVEIYAEDGDLVDPAEKAAQAQPFRPAIHLE